jgi:hypothetical protein
MDELFTRSFGQSLLQFDGGYNEMRAWTFDVEDRDHEVVAKAAVSGFEASESDVRFKNGSSPLVVRGHAGVGKLLAGRRPAVGWHDWVTQSLVEGRRMMRKWMAAVGLVVCGLLVAGCEVASSAGKKAEEGAKKAAGQAKEAAKEAKESAKEAVDAARVAVLKPIQEVLPKIEEKIKGLSGETATKAKEKLADFTKLLEQFKSAAPDKWESLKDGLIKAFNELKKLVGMD